MRRLPCGCNRVSAHLHYSSNHDLFVGVGLLCLALSASLSFIAGYVKASTFLYPTMEERTAYETVARYIGYALAPYERLFNATVALELLTLVLATLAAATLHSIRFKSWHMLGTIGATSIAIAVCKRIWPAMVIVDLTCVAVFFLAGFRPCFKYLYGRLQFYGQLSAITFEHMGLKTQFVRQGNVWRSEYVRRLREEALNYGGGIENRILTIFLARLYVSKWVRDNQIKPEEVRSKPEWSTITERLQQVFQVSPDIVSPEDRYVKPVFLGNRFARTFRWMLVDVLLSASRQWFNGERKT